MGENTKIEWAQHERSRIQGWSFVIDIQITPIPKPRMTQRDKWGKRMVVMRYRLFCDELRLKAGSFCLPDMGWHVVFIMPMPQSWSKKKRASMRGQWHQQKPDLDNLVKALCDAFRKDDSTICHFSAAKLWGDSGRIRITHSVPSGFEF